MTLLVLAYFGGILTILSPCVLPVLPFVFARAGRPFVSSILPMLVGMALTFALVATLAAVGGGWVVQANQYGRIAAMVLLAVFGLLLLWPSLADHVTQPLVALGNRLSQSADAGGERGSVIGSAVLGVAVGFLWAPCAGPILGLILTGAALQGANAQHVIAVAYVRCRRCDFSGSRATGRRAGVSGSQAVARGRRVGSTGARRRWCLRP